MEAMMATIPPPYTPQEAARRARDAWRAQAAAQRATMRAQRQYWRSMRRPSISGPIIMIVIGIVALLIVTGRINGPAFWMAYQRWWPLLFILVGVTLLLEWFLDRNQPYPVRRTAGGVVFLLILAGVAASIPFAHWNWGPFQDQFSGDGDVFHFMGEEHVNDTVMDLDIPVGAHVQIQNPRGDVNVSVSPDSRMHVRAHEVAYTNSENDARRFLKLLEPNVTINETNALIRVEGTSNGKANLMIELPVDAAADVSAVHGDVNVEGLRGSVNVNAGNGDVKLESLAGTANTRISKGDFSAHAIQGDLSVAGRMNDVTLSEIRGKVLLDGDSFGETHLERIESPLHFHTSRTDIEVARIAGEMTMGAGDLHLQQVQGPIKIVTRSKAIDCSQVFGNVHIENSNDDVNVSAGSPVGSIFVDNSHGSIHVGLPQSASFVVDANAKNGEIMSDFPLTASGSDASHRLVGEVGKGGPKITLSSDQGDIHLSKGDLIPALPPIPPIPPIPSIKGPSIRGLPAIPAIPGPVKHLRAPQGPTQQPSVQ
jgi:DUF4097 and DUF4098 domain-containing protein YvlB